MTESRSERNNFDPVSKSAEECIYPDCTCPFDMGPDDRCLLGLPRTRICVYCKHRFPEALGKYGCPNCQGGATTIEDQP